MAFFISWVLAAAAVAAQEDALERARMLAESGRTAEAIEFLESYTRHSPRPAELVYLAQLQAEAGGLPQAAVSLSRALDRAPDQEGLRVTLGAMLFELRQYEDAKRELELVLERRSSSALAHYYLAAVEKGLSDLDRAERSAERAVELLPPAGPAPLDSSEPAPAAAARHLLAEIRFELGKEVEPLLREVLAIEPGHASAHYLLARYLSRSGRSEEAEAELLLFSRMKRAEAHLSQGRDLARIGRTEEAIAEMRLAVEARPDDPRSLFFLGRELLRTGARSEALALLERAVALRPDAKAEVEKLLSSR
ncbi:MAG: tetratricopeptide repeat protein [Vicinamibacteria bacterium]